MKISQLNRKTFLSQDVESADNSDLVLNYAKTNVDPDVTTYRVTIAELGRNLIEHLHLVQYERDTENDTVKLKTLGTGTSAYEDVQLNEIQNTLNEADSAADSTKFVKQVTQTNGKIAVVHDTFSPVMTWNNATTTNVKPTLQITVAGNTAAAVTPNEATTTLYGITTLSSTPSASVENVAATPKGVQEAINLLDVSDTTDSTKYVSGVSETDGKITVSRADFSPSLTLTEGTSETAPKVKVTVAGNTSADITLTKATTSVFGATRLSNAINSTDENTAATSKAVKDAIESLDITQISNTAGKTVATISEQDGKVGATFQDISILSSQISDRGTAGCVATLDAEGHVPASQLPSYVDDVLEGTLATFPATGETGKIYVDTTTNTSYRWSGTQYTKVASDLSLGETSATAYRGDYGAAAYAHGVTNKGSAFTSNLYKITTNEEGHVTAATAVTSTDITNLFGKAIVLTDDSRLSDARNAADVSAWAKAATKPTYTATEVGVPTWAQQANKPSYTATEVGVPDWAQAADPPTTFNTITIGSTTLTEEQLQALLALLPEEEPEP